MRLNCLLGVHQRSSAVWWDGFDFCSRCAHCGTPLYKRGNKRWRSMDRARETMFLRYQAEKIALLPDTREARAARDFELTSLGPRC